MQMSRGPLPCPGPCVITSLDAPYECEIIQTAFLQLYNRLKGSDGVRANADSSYDIHVNNVKQYLLDCYVNSQTSLAAVLSAFKASKWIDVRAFVAAIEAIQQVNYDHSFFNKDELATTKNNLIRQKLLCKEISSFLQISGLQPEKLLIEIGGEDGVWHGVAV